MLEIILQSFTLALISFKTRQRYEKYFNYASKN